MTTAPLPPPPRIRPPGRFITSVAIFLSGCGAVLVSGGVLMWFNNAVSFRTNDNLIHSVSPDGKHQAVLFRRSNKQRDGYTTHVTIIPAGQKLPNRPGKAFIAEGEPSVFIRWTDEKTLVIEDPDDAKVILRAAQLGDIRISGR
ncbi:MAG: hypothetical protein EOP85_11535 [Verrucomicrobiaceae bacterium]|nr:MAG: hypothetical protein EOP85_11535 [Verrucomicrobiaceae bacterium]